MLGWFVLGCVEMCCVVRCGVGFVARVSLFVGLLVRWLVGVLVGLLVACLVGVFGLQVCLFVVLFVCWLVDCIAGACVHLFTCRFVS